MNQNYAISPRHISQSSQVSSIVKKQQPKTPFKMVPSVFQPPEDTQATYKYQSDQRSSFNHPYDNQTTGRYSQLNNQPFNPNIQFIKSLTTLKDCIHYEEGDSVPLETDDRWLIATGQLKIFGNNGYNFSQGAGFIFFISPEAKKKIREVVAIASSVLYRIKQSIFKEYVRNFLFVKNAEKIKYLKYCPFLTWNHSVAEDVATTMELIDDIEKDIEIYQYGDESDYLYFLKEGIVLLERFGKIGNNIVKEYQKHYESSHLSQEQGLLIVRKGMVFGVDGILIKELSFERDANKKLNPEQNSDEKKSKYTHQSDKVKNTRIYNAKTIGRCEIYRLDRAVLEAYFRLSDLKRAEEQNQINEKQLDRICLEYTNLLMGVNTHKKSLKKKQFLFEDNLAVPVDEELEKKKKKIQQIKEQEKKMKKVFVGSLDPKKHEKQYQTIEENPFKSKGIKKAENSSSRNVKLSDFSLPTVQKKHLERLIRKKIEGKEGQKFRTYKKKVEEELITKEKQPEKEENLQFMKVKSYRSLLSSLG